jgi:PAS domain S-box-containing protein
MNKGRILIVEDEFVVAENLRTDLESMGYEVVGQSPSGEEAMELAGQENPDLALMDIQLLGGMDGIETAIRLRQELGVPVLFLTAFADESFLERAKLAEPLGYLVKPFERKTFRASVEMAHYKATMERRLKESEERYRALFEKAQDGMAVADIETGVIASCNQALCRLIERNMEEIVGQPQSFLHPSQDLIDGQSPSYREHRRDPSRAALEDRLVSKSGRVIPVEIRATHLQINGRGHILGVFRDITERKQMEQRLQQAQKAESLGRMAAAIAHHFNNMLGAVTGNLELALDDLPQGSALHHQVTEAMKASGRAAEVSRSMLTYLGQTASKKEVIDFTETAGEAILFIGTSLPKNVLLEANIPPDEMKILADASHIRQILTNLILNASEAIGKQEGFVTVAVHPVPASDIHESRFFPLDWKPVAKSYACVSVSDTGCGIDAATQEKIFDPFFSTKFTGRGLGLPVAMGLVRAHKGALALESRVGWGSSFRLYLPISELEALQTRKEEVLISKITEGQGSVLLVEDEPMVRNMAQAMLIRLGYEVITACDGSEAVEIFREHKDEFALVLLDLTMPRMGGWETLPALRALRSDIPVILASGYDEAHVFQGDHPELPHAFLHKPYRMKDLKETLGAALSASPLGTEGNE